MTAPSEPEIPQETPQLKLLRRMVMALTAVMIGGVLVTFALIVIRLSDRTPTLPDQVELPDGARAVAVTIGSNWFAVVTEDERILIFDKTTGKLRQTVTTD
ncbi:hypothetical protein KQ247_15850 [Ruegeria pomeroyi]|jgi:hypothetical protein|uniref:Uncharacterized protein n=2 Tax=Ruegeria pomeroyi TaxID=89184 RepID=Q5LTK7_RUEPO|nr:DUF6476 family protein [Ruegeria pomeroyi]HCE71179.1 hypothetical protein [Ruegeria sp.]AAV94694.1 hypothetical protein SPO1407 [Ruegeria pomeroyi DSS-3]NVK95824.1 hypothetical protein [Ruegeria pomeroyi]NVL00197.1 hypothetical protein [Ruegeria pomeroyi]QWV08277.1 hypothetical protein KQ247_15850 [Ruegeria pomeroyi]